MAPSAQGPRDPRKATATAQLHWPHPGLWPLSPDSQTLVLRCKGLGNPRRGLCAGPGPPQLLSLRLQIQLRPPGGDSVYPTLPTTRLQDYEAGPGLCGSALLFLTSPAGALGLFPPTSFPSPPRAPAPAGGDVWHSPLPSVHRATLLWNRKRAETVYQGTWYVPAPPPLPTGLSGDSSQEWLGNTAWGVKDQGAPHWH